MITNASIITTSACLNNNYNITYQYSTCVSSTSYQYCWCILPVVLIFLSLVHLFILLQSIIIDTPIIGNGTADSEEPDNSITCTECSRTFESEWTLQTHFSLPWCEDFKTEICIPCKVELVTPCARKAHMRIHGLVEPFVCPDCGQRMYKKNVFLKHIRLHCLHYSVVSNLI